MRFNYPAVDYTFQPGDAMYEDINHDGNINYMDVVYLGNSNPILPVALVQPLRIKATGSLLHSSTTVITMMWSTAPK